MSLNRISNLNVHNGIGLAQFGRSNRNSSKQKSSQMVQNVNYVNETVSPTKKNSEIKFPRMIFAS